MKVSELERNIRQQLQNIYEESEASGIADIASEFITGENKTGRLKLGEEKLSGTQEKKLEEIIERLKTNEPVQYIINKAWFHGMQLYVDKYVLIPRPETEELVEWIINDVRLNGKNVFSKTSTDADETTVLKIIDIGTGSGCIALALKKEMPLAEVWGCDISDVALNVARRNGSELDIRIDFQSVDFLNEAQQKHLPSVDIVVSNPPYVPEKDKMIMQPNVLQYEPYTALFVDDNDPLVFYKSLVQFGGHRLHPWGCIYMEIHEMLGRQVSELFRGNGYEVEVRKDMQGKERMVKARKIEGQK